MTDVFIRRGVYDADTQTDDRVRTPGHSGQLQAKEKRLVRKQLCQHLELSLAASRTVRQWISAVLVPQSVQLCDGSPADERKC